MNGDVTTFEERGEMRVNYDRLIIMKMQKRRSKKRCYKCDFCKESADGHNYCLKNFEVVEANDAERCREYSRERRFVNK